LRPVFETEVQLAAIRGQARVLATATPFALGVIQNLTNYTFGPGFTYTVMAEPGQEVPKALIRDVQRLVDRFLDDNDWAGDREREVLRRTVRDGECFLALYPQAGGRVQLRFVDPEQVSEPQDPRLLEDWLGVERPSSWSFGVHTDLHDVEAVHGYHVRWNETGSDWDYLPAGRVEHLKLNVDRNVKRGVSDFYGVLQDLQREAKLRRNCAEGAALQAAIAWVQEMPQGTTEPMASSLVSSRSTGIVRTGPRTSHIQQYLPGTILRLPTGSRYIHGPLGAERNPNFLLIAQFLLRAIGVRWCLPEYMISGDAGNANYASTLVAESPFTKAREADQRFYARRFERLLWKMLSLSVRNGALSKHGVDGATLESLLDIRVDVPAVAVRDRLQDANVRKIEHEAGVLSRRTWAAEAGRDFETEQKNRSAEIATQSR
jgi:capsid protein